MAYSQKKSKFANHDEIKSKVSNSIDFDPLFMNLVSNIRYEVKNPLKTVFNGF